MPITQLGLKDVPEAFQKVTVVVAVESPAVGAYTALLSVPFDFEVDSITYALGNGAPASIDVDFAVEINGVDVSFTGPVTSFTVDSSTGVAISAVSANTGSGGAKIEVDVTAITGAPAGLIVQITLKRTAA